MYRRIHLEPYDSNWLCYRNKEVYLIRFILRHERIHGEERTFSSGTFYKPFKDKYVTRRNGTWFGIIDLAAIEGFLY
jgi:hypothetical protein